MIYLTDATLIPCQDNSLNEVIIFKLLNIENNKYVTNLNEDQIKQIYQTNKIKTISSDATRINAYELIKENGLKDTTLFFDKNDAKSKLLSQLTNSMLKSNITFYLKYETIDYNQGYIINSIDYIEMLFLKHLNEQIDKNKHYLITIYVDNNIRNEYTMFNWWFEEYKDCSLNMIKEGLLIKPNPNENKWFIADNIN